MSWEPPQPPRNNCESIVAYWQTIADIPESEPGAAILREWPRADWLNWVLSPATTATPNWQIRPEAELIN